MEEEYRLPLRQTSLAFPASIKQLSLIRLGEPGISGVFIGRERDPRLGDRRERKRVMRELSLRIHCYHKMCVFLAQMRAVQTCYAFDALTKPQLSSLTQSHARKLMEVMRETQNKTAGCVSNNLKLDFLKACIATDSSAATHMPLRSTPE